MEMKLAKKRYYKSFAISMGLYLIGMIGVSLMRKYMNFSIFILYGLTLLPILALLYGIAEHWRYVNSLDEYLRSRQIKAMMVGLALMLSISASWGILEEIADVARIPSLWFLVIFCVGYGLTEAFLNHRDKKHD
ncbi:MAG: hypothetical protein COB24_06625 [Hyphomicrobiales bacterium]|nr:MAG: hypothetical protein COB24_06625 [Hyphomicrobiales bacterium]